jgi:hypothetical protein
VKGMELGKVKMAAKSEAFSSTELQFPAKPAWKSMDEERPSQALMSR